MNRNAIKFRAFIPQEGYASLLEAKEQEYYKIVKPCLSEDDEIRINYVLTDSLNYKEQIIVTLYKNGFKEHLEGYITNFNKNNMTITLDDGSKAKINDIIDAEKK